MFKKILLSLAAFLLLVMLAGLALFVVLNQSTDAPGLSRNFTVEKGESLSSISMKLESQGIIRSALLLQIYGKILHTQDRFQSGIYSIPSGVLMTNVHDLLTSGSQVKVKVTVPEGMSSRQIGLLLEVAGVCDAKEFRDALANQTIIEKYRLKGLASLEGFLFPDTYLFTSGMPADLVVGAMVDNFFHNLGKIVDRVPDAVELFDKVRLASIIEKEYVAPDEAPLMASVFLNRLAIHKPLESCATVVYVMTEIQGLPHPSRIFFRDLARPSPYNTYINKGLPPGPISNPGVVALKASFYPAQTDYLYFVLKGQDAKRHFFSKTFAEHSKASVFYLKKN